MYKQFGELDSSEELNSLAEQQLAKGDKKAVFALAAENGIDKEDAQDYVEGNVEEFTTPLMAAMGKLKVESADLELRGILVDWKDIIVNECAKDKELCAAVRKKGKTLKSCMAELIKYSFEHKVQVNGKILKAVKIMHNGRQEAFKGPLYLGVPSYAMVKKIAREYYIERQTKA